LDIDLKSHWIGPVTSQNEIVVNVYVCWQSTRLSYCL